MTYPQASRGVPVGFHSSKRVLEGIVLYVVLLKRLVLGTELHKDPEGMCLDLRNGFVIRHFLHNFHGDGVLLQ